MDRFRCFNGLRRHFAEGRDFIIETRRGNGLLAVMAPHGGGIEPGTDRLAAAIAADTFDYYAFKGVRPKSNAVLHLASERFDEPRALVMAQRVQTIVTIHGCRDSRAEVWIGGLNGELGSQILSALHASGFSAEDKPRRSLAGIRQTNLCNRGRGGRGVQLEISAKLRRSLMGNGRVQWFDKGRFSQFVAAIQRVLIDYTSSRQPAV